jgi:hypothetical protein
MPIALFPIQPILWRTESGSLDAIGVRGIHDGELSYRAEFLRSCQGVVEGGIEESMISRYGSSVVAGTVIANLLESHGLSFPPLVDTPPQSMGAVLFAGLSRLLGHTSVWQAPSSMPRKLGLTIHSETGADQLIVIFVAAYQYFIMSGRPGIAPSYLGICGLRGAKYRLPSGALITSHEVMEQESANFAAVVGPLPGFSRQRGIPTTLEEMLTLTEKAGRKAVVSLTSVVL